MKLIGRLLGLKTQAIEAPDTGIEDMHLLDILRRLGEDGLCPVCAQPTERPGRLCWYCDDEPDDDGSDNFFIDFGGEG